MSEREMHSALIPPKGIWWKPAGAQEKRWVMLSFAWCMVLFAMMPLWHIRGGQNPTGIRSRVEPSVYAERVARFIEEYRVGEEKGYPVVAPPPGSDVYLLAQMWRWTPVIKLKRGVEYTLHLSAYDVNHGFSLFPTNVNIQVVPGYDYALRITPNESGDYRVICNEFCGILHHQMVGKIVVED